MLDFSKWFNEIINEDFKTQREKFITQGIQAAIVDRYMAWFKDIKDKKFKELFATIQGVNVPSPQRNNIDAYADFHELERVVDYVKGQRDVTGKKFTDVQFSGKPIYEGKGVQIFYADSPQACVQYKGNVPYSWCIARTDSSNMYYTYRYKEHEPAFYFVKDIEKTKAEFGLWNATKTAFSGHWRDKYHFFVVQVVRNATLDDPDRRQYIVTSAQNDGDEQMSWNDLLQIEPKLKGLQHVFQPKPLSPEERKDYERFKDGVSDEEFSKLDYNEKNRYLDIFVRFGQEITDKQFAMLPDDLKNKYIGFGIGLTPNQYAQIQSNKSMMKRYQDVTVKKIDELIKSHHNLSLNQTEIEVFRKSPEYMAKLKALNRDESDIEARWLADFFEMLIKEDPKVALDIVEAQKDNLPAHTIYVVLGALSEMKGSQPYIEAVGEKAIQYMDMDDDLIEYLMEASQSEKLAELLIQKHGKDLSHFAIMSLLKWLPAEVAKKAFQLKDKLDPEQIQDVLRPHHNDVGRERAYAAMGSHANLIAYPDGHRWVIGTRSEDNDHTYYLLDPKGDMEVKAIVRGSRLNIYRPEAKNLHSLGEEDPKNFRSKYIPPSNWNKYIVDFIEKHPEVHSIHSRSDVWNISDIPEEDRERLFKLKPELKPHFVLTTSDGYRWARSSDMEQENYELFDNYQPVLTLTLGNDRHGGKYISNGYWYEEASRWMTTGNFFDRKKYSHATAEFILHNNVEHVDHRWAGRMKGVSWTFVDMTPEDQELVLQKYPDFADQYTMVSKLSKDRAELMQQMLSGSSAYNVKLLPGNTDYVMLDDYNTIGPANFLQKSKIMRLPGSAGDPQNASGYKLSILDELSNKIHGESQDRTWSFEDYLKNDNKEALKKHFPFIDDEMTNAVKDKVAKGYGYQVMHALTHSIGKHVMPQVAKLFYEQLKPQETEEFKVLRDGEHIYFVTSFENFVRHYKQDNSLEAIAKAYKSWYESLKIDWKRFLEQIKELKRGVDKEALLNALADKRGSEERYQVEKYY